MQGKCGAFPISPKERCRIFQSFFFTSTLYSTRQHHKFHSLFSNCPHWYIGGNQACGLRSQSPKASLLGASVSVPSDFLFLCINPSLSAAEKDTENEFIYCQALRSSPQRGGWRQTHKTHFACRVGSVLSCCMP